MNLTPQGVFLTEKDCKLLHTYYELVGWKNAPNVYWTYLHPEKTVRVIKSGELQCSKKTREEIRIIFRDIFQ